MLDFSANNFVLLGVRDCDNDDHKDSLIYFKSLMCDLKTLF